MSGVAPQGARSPDALHQGFERIWRSPGGWRMLSAVNHTQVGIRFIVTGLAFFVIGGILALLIRTQLTTPDGVFDHDTYNQLFTMHGTTMMFLFAVPIMEGFAVYLIPKMIGARDLVFPRLGAFGYWCYLFGGVLLYSSFLFDQAPDGGWFMYVPLTGSEFTPEPRTDFWLIGVTFAEISAVTAAAELIVSILKTRAPGMSLQRMPLFAWYILVVAFMIVFGFPPLILGSILLEVERAFGLPFYDVAQGGDPLLWQHLFWIFGHPEVYIIFLPAAGVVSMIVPVMARVPLVAYTLVVLSAVATGFISFGLWVHHMFAVGIPYLALSFFSGASMAVAVPSGIQIFAWIATLWRGRPRLAMPTWFILGFLFIFVLGGLTGVMVASVPFNWQVHDTHFVVAHLHYVLIGGMVFPLFAGLYYWFPLATGRVLSDRAGRWSFWLIFLGFNIAFLPMHLTGLIGMPRRVYSYADLPGWQELNIASTVGAFVMAAGVAVFLADVFRSLRRRAAAPGDPWEANTLEWAVRPHVSSYNFISIPRITHRDPLWDQHELREEMARGEHYLADHDHGFRETMGTSVLSGEPEQVIRLPHPTWLPLVTALFISVFFVAFLVSQYAVAGVGVGLTVAALLVWAWRNGEPRSLAPVDAGHGHTLPLHYASPEAPGVWGTGMALLIDATLYASLLYAYYFLWTVSGNPPPPGYGEGELWVPALGLVLLVAGSVAMRSAGSAARGGRRAGLYLGLALAAASAIAFAAIQVGTLSASGLEPTQHAYPALIYSITGFHLLHVFIALLMIGLSLLRALLGMGGERILALRITAMFWHYTVIIWGVGFATLHLFPLLA